jgi:hypothetical protein
MTWAAMKHNQRTNGWFLLATVLALLLAPARLPAQVSQSPETKATYTAPKFAIARSTDNTPGNVLSADEWRQVDRSVDRGLAFLASQQREDGSFPSLPFAQPGVTSLAVLAFMAHGHTPGNGPYGQRLERAIQYIVACQKQCGLIMLMAPDGPEIDRNLEHDVGIAGTYDHAISSLTLAELYGMNPSANVAKLQTVINKSIRVSLAMQRWPKEASYDNGGWRYIIDYNESDSDLSVTGWHLMFLRSARNAGFDVPDRAITDAVAYIRRGYHYSLFMCCQGMYQMGSPYWEKFFPRTVRAVLAHQEPDGSWDAESFQKDRRFGNSYTTAMVILAVGAPNQLLPIFQR